jgi:copper chaperone CopZ
MTMQTAILTIAGMNSPASMRSVRSALSAIDGVEEVQISESLGETTVNYDPRKVLPKQFLIAVSVVGCEVGNLTLKPPAAGAAES